VVAVTGFKHPALGQLTDQQVRFAPPARRLEQLARAEKLLGEIDPAKRYPYQFVCYRITEFRPESYPDLIIPGNELLDDLRLMIQSLVVQTPSPAAPPVVNEDGTEPFLTLEEISKRWNVSTKTIRRWSKLGLTGRKVPFNGRQQLAFKQSVVERFLAVHRDRVERGMKFSQLSDDEREEILRRAKRLSRLTGGTLTEISRRIARRLNRSAETIRYTIKNFDREHPEQALFPKLTGPLDEEMKQTIYTSYRRGMKVDTLAKRFQRTRTSMYRVINEVRAQRLLEQPLDYIPHESFENASPALEAEILGPMPDAEEYEAKRHQMKAPKDVAPEFASMYEVPLLNKEQEQHQFRKMNYLKYKAAKLRDRMRKDGGNEVDPSRVRIQTLKEIEDLQAEANKVKDLLIEANMRLVMTHAKKHAPHAGNIFELLSDGNMSLIRAVEKFDFGRGFKFSTYASWAIIKNFARSIPDEKHRRERFVTGHEDLFEVSPDNRSDEHEMLATQERATHSVNRLLEYLEPRERDIIRMRAGLDDNAKGMTLEEIGKQFNITKERVRQLNARAMKKLRDIAKEQELDMP
jgi:RNA polymerase sigma factor (sigma-70 family)